MQDLKMQDHCKIYSFILGNAVSCSPALPLPASVDALLSGTSQIRYQNTQEIKHTLETYYLDVFPKSLLCFQDWQSLSSAQAVLNLFASPSTYQPRSKSF